MSRLRVVVSREALSRTEHVTDGKMAGNDVHDYGSHDADDERVDESDKDEKR